MVAFVSFFAMASDGSGKAPSKPLRGAPVVLTIYLTYYQVMKRVNLADAKARFSHYVESVESGETIILCRRNVPVAELRPLKAARREPRRTGIDRGMELPGSFFEPLPDELLEAFEGAADAAP